jgi:preprotein translocase subunit SecA
MLASLKALRSEDSCVNVITSSSFRAISDLNESKKLFDIIGLTSALNCDKECEENESSRRGRYKQQIVYGDIGSF